MDLIFPGITKEPGCTAGKHFIVIENDILRPANLLFLGRITIPFQCLKKLKNKTTTI